VKTRTMLATVGGTLVFIVVAVLALLTLLVGNGLSLSPDLVSSGTLPRSPTATNAPSTQPADTALLLQTDDFFLAGLDLSADQLRSDGGQQLTACTGRLTMIGLTSGRAADKFYLDASWYGTTTTGIQYSRLTQSVSRAATKADARAFVARLVSELAGCSYAQGGDDRRLGDPIPVRTSTGTAVRFVAYGTNGRAVGGVGVFRNGRKFGVYEVVGAGPDDPSEVLDLLTRRAVARCG
jgi:hypothetical protein